jgi:hypothetical protein
MIGRLQIQPVPDRRAHTCQRNTQFTRGTKDIRNNLIECERWREGHVRSTLTHIHAASMAELYGTSQIPETYIIDRDGVLRSKFVSSLDWNSPEVLQFLKSL